MYFWIIRVRLKYVLNVLVHSDHRVCFFLYLSICFDDVTWLFDDVYLLFDFWFGRYFKKEILPIKMIPKFLFTDICFGDIIIYC